MLKIIIGKSSNNNHTLKKDNFWSLFMKTFSYIFIYVLREFLRVLNENFFHIFYIEFQLTVRKITQL